MQQRNIPLKDIRVKGTISSHQWGIVADRGGYYSDNSGYKPQDTDNRFKTVQKKIIVKCDLGVGGERGRVVSRISTSVTATEHKDPIKVIKKWKKI